MNLLGCLLTWLLGVMDTVTDKILNWPFSCSWSGRRIKYKVQGTEISLILMVRKDRQLGGVGCVKAMEKPGETLGVQR